MSNKPVRRPRTPTPNVLSDDFQLESPPSPAAAGKPAAARPAAVKAPPAKPAAPARKPRHNPMATSREGVLVAPEARPGRPAAPAGRTIVNLDTRQLTKKQKSQLEVWSGTNRGRALDGYLKGLMTDARTQFGHSSVWAARDTDKMLIGIPTPAPAFEYLIAQDVFPLGLELQLVGPPGSNKTALLGEFYRWFAMAGGCGHYLENETKHSPDLFPSIFGWGEMPILMDRCHSVEDWQRHMTYWIAKQQQKMIGTQKEPGPGRTIPVLFGVDSIMGKMSEETQEKVRKTGAAERSFPIEANKINIYLKTIPQMIDGWPFALVFNNHVKLAKDDMGRDQRRKPGGEQVTFQESFEIETHLTRSKLECADWSGMQVGLRCYKNSMAGGHRKIETRMMWWEEKDPETGLWRQKTVWDWDWATVKLLSTLEGRESAKLKEAGFHLATPSVSDFENLAWSENLGMKDKDAVRWTELGRMIREDNDLMQLLRGALGIKRRPLLAGDYLRQLEGLREALP